jgi:thiamine biosynthesis lipoprotein ApbE
MSKIRIIREERDELDFVIAQKLRKIQELGEKIKDLEGKLEKLLQAEASKTCPEQPTMAQLLQYCSRLKDATQGNLTPNPK